MFGSLRRTLLSLSLVATPLIGAHAQQLTGEGPMPGTSLEIRDLKRDDGGMLTLRFRLINQSKFDVNLEQLAGSNSDLSVNRIYGTGWIVISAVHLVDAANRKKYLVVRDDQKKCLCAVVSALNLKAGQALNLWAKFPAPPGNVPRVSVVVPLFDPIDNVPIYSR